MKPNKKVMSDMVASRSKKESAVSAKHSPLTKPSVLPKQSAPLKQSAGGKSSAVSIRSSTPTRSEGFEPEQAPVAKRLTPPPLRMVGDTHDHEPQKMGCALWVLLPVCLLALTLVIGGLVSGARITITPQVWKGGVDTTTTFVLGEKGGVANQASLAFYTATKKFTQEATVPAIETAVTESTAQGTVRVYNTSAQSVTIPAKTQITLSKLAGTPNPKVSYVTDKSITLPKGTPEKPSQKDVLVKATKSGTVFNTQPTDFAFMSPIAGLTIRGVTAIDGGADPADRTISPEVLSSTQAQLLTRFDDNQTLIARVVEDTPSDMIALPLSFTSTDPEVSTHPSGESSLTVTVEKTVTAILVKRSDLAKLLGARIGAADDTNLTVSSLNGLTIATTALGSAENIPKTIPVRITGEVQVLGEVPEAQILSKITGKSKREAKAYIGGLPEVKGVDIHTVPFWRRILPLDANKISVTVLNP